MMIVYHWVKKSQAIIIATRIIAKTTDKILFELPGSTPMAIRKRDIITIEIENA